MYTHGVDPKLDFSDMPALVELYERVTRMKVYDRSPYSGALVFAAFSGSPQYILSPQEIPTYETASDVDFLSRACSVYVSTVKSKFKACLIAFATASRRPLPSAV